MSAVIISAIVAFIATNIDDVFILLIFFARMKKEQIKDIVIGQYLGYTVIIAASLLGAFGLSFVAPQWIGLLGIIPIFLGIRFLIKGETDSEEDEVMESTKKYDRLFLSVAAVTIAGSGDNLGVYIPYFTTLDSAGMIVTVAIFYILVAVLCYIGYRLSAFKSVSEVIEKYEKIIVPVVFVGLGIYIMYENHTFSMISALFA